MRVIGYIRVSSLEQADSGLGLKAQRHAIESECTRRGWNLVAVHEDAGLSGKRMKRPGLEAALGDVEQGGGGALVVAKLDRLSRSLVDFAGLMERSRRKGWSLVALDLGVDTTTPSGEFLVNVLASAAQWERRIIGQRTKDALAVKKGEGVRLGRPVLLRPDIRARIVAERAAGASLGAIAGVLNEEGVPTAQGGARWLPSTVAAVLLSIDREHVA